MAAGKLQKAGKGAGARLKQGCCEGARQMAAASCKRRRRARMLPTKRLQRAPRLKPGYCPTLLFEPSEKP